MTPPILITGCRRSGTTLLRTLLNNHPDLCVHPAEPQFMHEWVRQHGYSIPDINKAVEFVSTHRLCPENVSISALETYFRNKTVNNWHQFVQGYLHVWAGEQAESKRIVLKDPLWLFEIDLVDYLFPDAIIVQIVRDPRANVSSQKSRWQNASTYTCATWWREAVSIGYKLSLERPKKCITIFYEALVMQPKVTLKTLLSDLSLSFLPEITNFQLATIDFAPNAPPQNVSYSDFLPDRLTRWQTRLSYLDIAMIELICQMPMSLYQYQPQKPAVSKFHLFFNLFKQALSYYVKTFGGWVKNRFYNVLNRQS